MITFITVHQNALLCDFLIKAILSGRRWNLCVVLIYISHIANRTFLGHLYFLEVSVSFSRIFFD